MQREDHMSMNGMRYYLYGWLHECSLYSMYECFYATFCVLTEKRSNNNKFSLGAIQILRTQKRRFADAKMYGEKKF